MINISSSNSIRATSRYTAYSGYIGSSAFRSFIPVYAEPDQYILPVVLGANPRRSNTLLVQSLAANVFRVFIVRQGGDERLLRVLTGLIVEEKEGRPFIHLMVAKHVDNSEIKRMYVSNEFIFSDAFKNIFKKIRERYTTASDVIVIHPDIVSLFFDKVKIPDFKSLQELAEFKEQLINTLYEQPQIGA